MAVYDTSDRTKRRSYTIASAPRLTIAWAPGSRYAGHGSLFSPVTLESFGSRPSVARSFSRSRSSRWVVHTARFAQSPLWSARSPLANEKRDT